MNGSWRQAATRRVKRHWRYLLVVVAVYAGALALGQTLTTLRANFQNVVFDQYQRWRPRATGAERLVRVVDIDDESIRRLGQWPWPRAEMAKLVDALAGAKAAAIGFDVLFSETDRAPVRRRGRRRRRGFRPSAGRSIRHPERARHPDQTCRRRSRQERIHLHRPGPHARSAASQRRARAADGSGQERRGNRLR